MRSTLRPTERAPGALINGLTRGVELVSPKVDPAAPANVIRYTVLKPPIALKVYLNKSEPNDLEWPTLFVAMSS